MTNYWSIKWTWESLVPLANSWGFCCKALDVSQVSLRVEHPLIFGRRGHKHWGGWLLQCRLSHLSLTRVRWWSLLSWANQTHLNITMQELHYFSDSNYNSAQFHSISLYSPISHVEVERVLQAGKKYKKDIHITFDHHQYWHVYKARKYWQLPLLPLLVDASMV